MEKELTARTEIKHEVNVVSRDERRAVASN